MINLLWRSANERLGVQQGIQLPQNGCEVGVLLHSGQQVVVPTLLFNYSCCLLGQDTNLLMTVLNLKRKYRKNLN